jgi:putative transposase
MKYQFMEEHRDTFSIKRMCRILRVSRSGYYVWRMRMPSIRGKDNARLFGHIRDAYRKGRRVYGSPRITVELNERGIRCGKSGVARIMRENHIRAAVKRSFRRTTDSKHGYALAANLLLPCHTDQLWASDITFVPTRGDCSAYQRS